MVISTATFAAYLASIHSWIEGLSPGGYAYDASDGWTLATVPYEWTRHLHFWVDFGSSVAFTKPAWEFSGSVIYGCRYVPDDDAISQATIHASALDLGEALLRWHGERARIRSVGPMSLDAVSAPSWVSVSVPFVLHLERS